MGYFHLEEEFPVWALHDPRAWARHRSQAMCRTRAMAWIASGTTW
jgi:hypothetical protein